MIWRLGIGGERREKLVDESRSRAVDAVIRRFETASIESGRGAASSFCGGKGGNLVLPLALSERVSTF